MNKILTNKGIIVKKISNDEFTFSDTLKNKVNVQSTKDIIETCKENNLKAIAIKTPNTTSPVNPELPYSSIIYDTRPCSLLEKISLLLKILREIEDIAFQLITGDTIDEQAITTFLRTSEIEANIRDGHISHEDYEKFIKSLPPNIQKALITKNTIVELGDLIRTELCHADFCILNSVQALRLLIQQEDSRDPLNIGAEMRCYGYYPDSATWSFIDSIKAISTALDILTKLTKFCIDLDHGKTHKTSKVVFGNIKQIKSWDQTFLKNYNEKLLNTYIEKLYLLLKFRHQVTHDSGLFNAQNSAFIGYGTPCVNSLNVAYAELLFWDHQDKHFSSAEKYTGFFTQQNNAISFAHDGLENAVLLSEHMLKAMRLNLLKKCETVNLDKLTTLNYNINGSITRNNNSPLNMKKDIIV